MQTMIMPGPQMGKCRIDVVVDDDIYIYVCSWSRHGVVWACMGAWLSMFLTAMRSTPVTSGQQDALSTAASTCMHLGAGSF